MQINAMMGYHLHPLMTLIKKTDNNNIQDMKKLELSHTAGRNVKWQGCFENIQIVPQNIKHTVTTWKKKATQKKLRNTTKIRRITA